MELKDIKLIIDYIENLPDLKWEDSENCEECFSTTSFGEYSIRYICYDEAYSLYFNDEKLLDNYKRLDDIKKEANDDYKSRIKSALKL